MTARIFVVSPMEIASEMIANAFSSGWPEARIINLIDESLYADFAGGKPQTEETGERVSKLLHYAADAGADGMIFTGSVFGRWVEMARSDIEVPCLTSFEAMIEEAFANGNRFGILVTAPGSLKCLVEDIDRYSRVHNLTYSTIDHIEDAARPIILAGDIETHDRMVAEAAANITDCDCLMLGQFSMGRAAQAIGDVPGRPVLTAPEAGVRKLKRLLG